MKTILNDSFAFLDLSFINIDESKMDLSLIDVTR